jgi:hypothetical protein
MLLCEKSVNLTITFCRLLRSVGSTFALVGEILEALYLSAEEIGAISDTLLCLANY